MSIFAQKQNQPQQQSLADRTRSNMVLPAANHADDTLHLQRTIGNQAVLRLLQAKANVLEAGSDTEVDSETPATAHFAHDFSRIPVHAQSPITIQPKLTISTPGDVYEQEADHIAEQVMRMPEPQLQRACACGSGCPSWQTEQTGQEHPRLQSKHVGSNPAGSIAAPPIVHEVLASPGQPLNMTTRNLMEPRFGHDFSRVRVHANARAAESAQAIAALAYTVGNDIIFARGQYAPETVSGKRLMVHELAHVIQQSASGDMVRRAPDDSRLEVLDARISGRLKSNERRAAASCDIKCGEDKVGTLHAMPLQTAGSYATTEEPKPAVYTATAPGDVKANAIIVSLHFVKSGKSAAEPKSGCVCSGFKIIQVVTRGANTFVDVRQNNYDDYKKVIESLKNLTGLDAPMPPPYYDRWAENRKGRDEDEIPKNYPDAGAKVKADHSIYDRPVLDAPVKDKRIAWKAEACVVCQRDSKQDKILGGISYGMSRTSFEPMTVDTLECIERPTAGFLKTLKTDSKADDYDFEGKMTIEFPYDEDVRMHVYDQAKR